MGDRVFWGAVLFVFICLFWLKYLERFIPMWFGTIVAVAAFLAMVVVARPKRSGHRVSGGKTQEH